MRSFKLVLAVSSALTASFIFASAQVQAADLVFNGGFEQPALSSGTYSLTPSIPGWSLGADSVGASIEVQNNVAGAAYEGSQFVELNSTAPTSIYQDLNTVAGQNYNVSFAYSPRPGVLDNTLHFTWGGQLTDTLTSSGVGNTDTVWTVHNYTLTASSSSTRLKFDDLGDPNNSVGTYLDKVQVTPATPEPGSIALLAAGTLSGIGFLARRKRATK